MENVVPGMRIECIYSSRPSDNELFFEIDTNCAAYRFSTVLYFVSDRGTFALSPALELTEAVLPSALPDVSVMFPDIAGYKIKSVVKSEQLVEITTEKGCVRIVR